MRRTGTSTGSAALSTVTAYVIERAQAGRKVATSELDLAAIRARYRLAGHELDTGTASFAAVWQGIRRKHAAPQKQAAIIATVVELTAAMQPIDTIQVSMP